MIISEFISKLDKTGIKLWIEKDKLRYKAPEGVLNQEVRDEIIKYKLEIIDYLKKMEEQLCIHRLLEKQVENRPEAVAVSCEDEYLTFRQLNNKANRLSRYLETCGVGTNDRIGFCVRHTIDMIVGILAILKAGGTCVPLEPGYPPSFQERILEENNVSILLTQTLFLETPPKFSGKTTCIDCLPGDIESFAQDNPSFTAEPDNIAFILYSGDSCTPISHRTVANNGILWPRHQLNPEPGESYLFKTALCGENLPGDIFLPLCSGGQLVVVSPNYCSEVKHLPAVIEKQHINIAGFTTNELVALLDYYKTDSTADLSSLKLIFSSGEPLSENIAQEFLDYFHTKDLTFRLYSFYNLTQLGGPVALYQHKTTVEAQNRKMIGDFNPDITFYILDKFLNPVPTSVPGEMYIAINEKKQKCLTGISNYRQRIRENPFEDKNNPYLLKTNDRCQRLSSGSIEYLGCTEPLYRINDYRIDTNYIETVVLRQPDAADCMVTVKETNSHQRYILAYIVPARDNRTGLITEAIQRFLPFYMAPSAYIFVSCIARDASGEIDVKSLEKVEIIDMFSQQHLEERLNRLPGIKQAAVTAVKQSRIVPSLHLSDIAVDWKQKTDVKQLPLQPARAGDSPGKPMSDKPALVHGEPLEFQPGEPGTLAQVLLKTASCFPDNHICYVLDEKTTTRQTYAELLQHARQILAGLRKTGLKAADKVIFQLKNNWHFVSAFWACHLGGFVPVPIGVPHQYTKENATAAKLHNAWSGFGQPLVLTAEENMKNLEEFPGLFQAEGFSVAAIEDLYDNEPDPHVHESEPDDLALILLTSGSTGLPKGVMQTHRSLIGRSKGTVRLNGFTSEDISMNWMPLDHVGGIVMFHLRDVYAGCTQVQMPIEYVLQDPLRWMQQVDFFKATITWAPNFAFALVNEHYKKQEIKPNWDLSSMRFILNGGEAIVAKTAREFLKNLAPHGLPGDCMHPAWGMSETCSGVAYSSQFSLETTSDEDAFVEIGGPIPGFSMRIVNHQDQIVNENETGHLQVKGFPVTTGFYKNDAVTRESFTADGWFKTGDLGIIKNGKLTITGRSKNEIIINGINYYSHEIESVVENIEGVEVSYTAACAIRNPGCDTDQLAIFFHTPFSGDRLKHLLKEVNNEVVHQVAIKPDFLIPMGKEAVPKTDIGKIQHSKLKDAFAAGEFNHIIKEVDILTGNNTIPNWFFYKRWQPKTIRTFNSKKGSGDFLVFKDQAGLSDLLVEELDRNGSGCITVEAGKTFERLSRDHYCIDAAEKEHYDLLVQGLKDDRRDIGQVLHLWGYKEYDGEIGSIHQLEQAQDTGVYSLLFILQALAQTRQTQQGPLQLRVISTNNHHIKEDDKVSYEKSPVIGLLKTSSQEIPWLESYQIDFADANPRQDISAVLNEVRGVHNDQLAAYRDGERLVPYLVKADGAPNNKKAVPFKNGGFYLLSGGLGGIGKEISYYLLENYQAKLLLVGTTPLPPLSQREQQPDQDNRVSEKMSLYRDLQQLDGDILYHAADICDPEALKEGINKAKALWHQDLDGILHLAGKFRECPLLEETREGLDAVLRPKMTGTWVLNRLLADTSGQDAIFISFSSVNGFWGGASVGGYAAANSFLDTFAQHQQSGNGRRALALSWSMWDETGMSRGYRMKAFSHSQGFYSFSPDQGIYSLLFALQNHADSNLFIGVDGNNENILRYIHHKPYSLQKLRAFFTIPGNIEKKALFKKLAELEIKNRFNQSINCEFMEISQMPALEDGSIDRKKLQLSETEKRVQLEQQETAESEVTGKILQIMKELLKSPGIDVHDNFFEVGGQSILAMKFLSSVKDTFEIEEDIPVKLLFENPTAAELGKSIEELVAKSHQAAYTRIQPVSREERIPLSFAQQRLWFLYRLEPDSAIYNSPLALKLKGNLDISALEKSLNAIIKRHEILRTTFKEMDGSPYQDIAEELNLKISIKDLKGLKLDEEAWEKLRSKLLIEEACEPFDLSRGPLIRARIFIRNNQEYALQINIHHIIFDGWSLEPFFRELFAYYSAYVTNTASFSLPQLPIQYADFSVWQKKWFLGETYKKQMSYWKEQLSGKLPILNLPTDKPRPANQTVNGTKKYFEYSHSLSRRLKTLSSNYDVTMFMLLFTAFQTLLYRYSGNEDIIMGSPIANRNRKEVEHLLGFFVNTLPLRLDLSGNPSFSQLLKRGCKVVLDAFENQDLPFELLVKELQPERNLDQNPVFQVLFVLENTQVPNLKLPGLELEPLATETRTSIYDMTVILVEVENQLAGFIQYNTDLFYSSTIQRIIDCFETLLEGIIGNPEQKISHLPLLSEEERLMQIEKWNETEKDFSDALFLHQIFEKQVEKTPDATAAVFENYFVTYHTLNHKSNQLARHLRALGVRQEVLVGVCINRSMAMIIGVLGILKAGGGFLALDPAYPEERIAFMLNDSGVSVLLTRQKVAEPFSFESLENVKKEYKKPIVTDGRPPVQELDKLPIPDRTLIDYESYHRHIGLAMVKNYIMLQTSRGCPFNCAYCHKIWPKKHVFRSAENIFREIKLCCEAGARKFAFADDIFNLNIKHASQLLEMIIKNRLDVQLLFPNGLRGDILTREFIDLLMEAGTIDLMLALETASPRLQKLIGKNLNLEKFQENLNYILKNYPGVILQMDTMHGFPTETEEEALMTLEFVLKQKWLHFPNLNILKIFPNTDMHKLALANGISNESINRSTTQAYHDLPETLPFPRSFSIYYQSRLLNEYVLSKERLLAVLPSQMKILTEDELVQKYDSYLPTNIESVSDILKTADISWQELGDAAVIPDAPQKEKMFGKKIRNYFPAKVESPDTLRVLLLDLSLTFTHEQRDRFTLLSEQPMGLMYLMTYLNQQFGNKVFGKIAKSRIDFDSFEELKALVTEFRPDVIGVRTLTYFKEFFHRALSQIKQWLNTVPIIAGGPYSSSDYELMLQDSNIDIAVLGEGELTFAELIGKILENDKKLPDEEQLSTIKGISYIKKQDKQPLGKTHRQVLFLDEMYDELASHSGNNLDIEIDHFNRMYVIYTSGSTGRPKGISMTHRVIANLLNWQKGSLLPIETPKTLQFSSLNFDVSIQEMASAWGTGAALVLIPEEVQQTAEDLLNVMIREDVQRVFMPAIILQHISEIAENRDMYPVSVREFITAGEQLHISDSIANLLKHLPEYAVHNHYGVSESHVVTALSLRGDVETWPTFPTVGKAIHNSRIYILDPYLQPVPIGVPGEIHIGGVGLSRAFANRPQMTAEKYIPDIYCNENGARMYRSGDLGRFRTDGNIEFLGRIDTQVKVRGYRIELGEIESVMNDYPPVQEAAAAVKTDRFNKKYLVGYVVVYKNLAFNEQELRELLKKKLPEYMVPSAIVQLDQMPLTPSRKVDIRSLPELSEINRVGVEYTAPRNYTEELVAGILSEVLGVSQVGISDNFFELGGHSLLATQVTSRIRSIFNVELPVRELFENPTLAQLSAAIKAEMQKQKAVPEGPLAPQPITAATKISLSFAQERLWFIQQLLPNRAVYNLPGAMKLKGSLNIAALEQSLNRIIERHEALRTTFTINGEQPVQKITPSLKLTIPIIDISGINNKQEQEKQIRDYVSKEAHYLFDLSKAPLFRVTLLHLDKNEYILLLNMHHIISDGWSMGIFIRELSIFYSANISGTSPSPELPPLPIQYKDFAIWQRKWLQGGVLENQLSYWKKQLENCQSILNLPTDKVRPLLQTFNGSRESVNISLSKLNELKAFSQKRGVTLFMTLLAALQTLLYRYSGQEDIVIGTSIANRNRSETENIIGFFVNTLVLRADLSGNPTFIRLLKQVKEVTLDAYAHQDLSFEKIVEELQPERDLSRNPLFQVLFTLQNAPEASLQLPGITLSPVPGEYDVAKFDLNILLNEHEEGLDGMFEYSTDLFYDTTIQRMVTHFLVILDKITSHPQCPVASIPLLTESEEHLVLNEWNNTNSDYPRTETLYQLFERQVENIPHHTAITAGWNCSPAVGKGKNMHLTYLELNRKSDLLAHLLRQEGVDPGAVVGIMMNRSMEAIIAILGILKAGGVYLPIDPGYPADRVHFMLADSGAKAAVGTRELIEKSMNMGVGRWEGKKIFAEEIFTEPALPPMEPVAKKRSASAASLAYVIYTSGSTGFPKGVMVEHRNVVNYICWAMKQYMGSERIDLPLFTSLSFDLTVTSIFTPLLSGNAVVVYEGEGKESLIQKVIEGNQAGVVKLTPSHLKLIVESVGETVQSNLKGFIVGGEALETELARKILEKFNNNIVIYNEYGPTEATVGCMIYKYCPETDVQPSVPIGVPADNVQVYILDISKSPTPVGVPGEMYISGDSVARGYLNRQELTAERFIKNPFLPHRRMYQTGDLARFMPTGNVEFLGRMDQQVKIRGFRIEPGEIESRLTKYKRKHQVAVSSTDFSKIDLKNIHRCQRCLLPEGYPGIQFDEKGVCNICRKYDGFKDQVKRYFKNNNDFVQLINDTDTRKLKGKQGEYDCLLLFSGGKDSTYVLHQLIDMGLKVLTFTFDNGFISKAAFANIKRTTRALNVKNIVCKAENMNKVFVESLNSHHSVCHGCWNALNTFGAKTAHEYGINLVISGLSRGQIFEMRLEGLFQQGIFDEEQIEQSLLLFRKSFHSQNNKFLRIMGIDLAEEVVEQIHFVDYFRYFDAPVSEIRRYLSQKGWVQPKDTGFCSSNCLINDVGIYTHLKGEGYHFYEPQLSWDCRLGSIPREQGLEEIDFKGDWLHVDRVLKEIGYYSPPIKDALVIDREGPGGDKILVAYLVSDHELVIPELREYLAQQMPDYMIPQHFVQLYHMPLTEHGKIDRRALPEPEIGSREDYVAPRNDTERKLVEIWSEILNIEKEVISIQANFFTLGGHSLRATVMVNKIQKEFNIEVLLTELFRGPTIKDIASLIDAIQTRQLVSSTVKKEDRVELEL
jgi:amino acid adenylation domain-containing protein